MPELPEVETLVREIRPLVSGLVLSQVRIFEPAILKTPADFFKRKLSGKKILTVSRRGKFLVFELSGKFKLWFHLGMTGQLLWTLPSVPRDKHVHLVLEFENSSHQLIFRDIRKFGKIFMTNGAVDLWPEGIRLLAQDPFEMGPQTFKGILKGRDGRIKSLLMNQRLIAGIGNIYADESLYEARVHPRSKPARLSAQRLENLYSAIRKILEQAIQHGGSSIDDYLHADGGRGRFQNCHKVYGREEKPCFACGSLIRRIRLSGRSSFFCPQCQKL